MTYQSLYRKWRPKTFDDVVGQDHITATLKNEILTGKTAHAYLFCGTRGTGKTSCARIFAKAVNCRTPNGANPCCTCDICTGIDSGSVLDIIEIDAASNNGVDNIREIRDEVIYHPSQAKYKVYIIDEVHMLSTSAFNALLKTLEEPPEHVIFILATTEAHALLPTITSRCQRFDFRRITVSDIIKRLKEVCYNESIKADDDSLELIANIADGALRDALSILDRCAGACEGNITLEAAESVLGIAPDEILNTCVNCIASKDSSGILNTFDAVVSNGRDLTNFVGTIMRRFRDIMVYKTVKAPEKLFEYSKDAIRSIKNQSEAFSNASLSYILRTLNTALNDAKFSKNPRIMFELAMFKLCDETIDADPDALIRRIEALEEKLKNGNFASVVSTVPPVDNTPEFNSVIDDELPPWDEAEPEVKPEAPAVKEEPASEPMSEANTAPVQTSADWPSVLDYMKKSSPALFGTLSVKKAIIFENKLYIPDEAYLKAIISAMESTLEDACKTVLGFVPTLTYASEAEIDKIVQKRAAVRGLKEPDVTPIVPSEPTPFVPEFVQNSEVDFADDFADNIPPAPVIVDEGYNLEEDDYEDEDEDFDPLNNLLNLSEDIHIEE